MAYLLWTVGRSFDATARGLLPLGYEDAVMRVMRGRSDSPAADREVTASLVDHVAETGERALRAWYPPAHVAFGRRDANAPGYDCAREIAEDRGFPTLERTAGGRAVAFTGAVLAVALAEPADVSEPDIDARYERTLERLADGLAAVGADISPGEPPDSFCPGTHSLQTAVNPPGGGKVAGLAQRVRREVAVVGGAVVVADAEAVAEVLAPVYDALDLSFDRTSVGCVACSSDGPVRKADVREAVESAFADEGADTVEVVDGPDC